MPKGGSTNSGFGGGGAGAAAGIGGMGGDGGDNFNVSGALQGMGVGSMLGPIGMIGGAVAGSGVLNGANFSSTHPGTMADEGGSYYTTQNGQLVPMAPSVQYNPTPTLTPGQEGYAPPSKFGNLEDAGVFGANQALGIYNQGPPQLYGGPGVAGFGDTSNTAHAGIKDLATGNPYLANATGRVNDVVFGENPFLDGFRGFSDRQNKYLDASFDRGAEQIQDRLNSQFGRAGRTNSGYHVKTMGDSLGDFGATLYGNAFDAQMNRDLAALNSGSNAYNSTNTTRLNAANMLPALNDAKFSDFDRLQSLGQAQDIMSQMQLDDEITRFNEEQNSPWSNLQNYMSIVNSGSPTQQPNVPETKSNSTAQTLGTIGLLASLF